MFRCYVRMFSLEGLHRHSHTLPVRYTSRRGRTATYNHVHERKHTHTHKHLKPESVPGSHLLALGNRTEESGLRMKYSSATLLIATLLFTRRGVISR